MNAAGREPLEPVFRPDLTLYGDDHVARYLETDGAEGHIWNGVTCLILTTRGRRSGIERKLPLVYLPIDGGWVVIASRGGAAKHPEWYLNLLSDSDPRIQVGAQQHRVVARVADETERPDLWRRVVELWPNYEVYQSRTDRQIPVVVLTPRED